MPPDGGTGSPDRGSADGPSPGPHHAHDDAHHDAHGGVEVAVAEGVTAVRFWGSVDLVVREARAGGFDGLRGTTPLTVDLRDVEFMDSTGLSVLVRVVRDAAEDGRDVRLLGASSQVHGLLATTGVDVWMASLGVRPA